MKKAKRLTPCQRQTMLAQRETNRVYLFAPEQAENATIAACTNALRSLYPL